MAPRRAELEQLGPTFGGDADLDADDAALGVTGAGGGNVAAVLGGPAGHRYQLWVELLAQEPVNLDELSPEFRALLDQR